MGDNKELKRQRIKMYFLKAAKQIITDEGVKNVSVRKVADMAGYSYPTLYNYFEDLNELLWEAKGFMINDLVEIIKKKTVEPISGTEGLKMLFKAYIAYYLDNPNIFKFFYFYQLHTPGKKLEDAIGEPDYNSLWGETFKYFVLEGKLKEKDIEVVAKIFIYAMQGMLTLYFSNNGDLNEEVNMYKDLETMVDYLM
jgi:AcrR family transcriptional regulator